MLEFAGKTAVVTGGGSGIGRGMCLAFAGVGMNVVVADIELAAARAVADEIRSDQCTPLALEVDVASRSSVETLAEAARSAFGSVEVLCSNAGVSHRRRGIHATHEDWMWMLGVNLWGSVHAIEAFLPAMLSSGDNAHIVITSSINGILPSAVSAMYSTAKFGLVGMTETLRNELSDTKVSISVLCPGAVYTRLSDSERNRPSVLEAPTRPPAHVPSWAPKLGPPQRPEVVGEMVLQGIRENSLFIFTDVEARPLVEEHHARMMEGFDALERFEMARTRSAPDT